MRRLRTLALASSCAAHFQAARWVVLFAIGVIRVSAAADPLGKAREPAICDRTLVDTGLGDRLVDFVGLCTYARMHDAPLYSLFLQGAVSKLWPDTCAGHACREYDVETIGTPAGCHLLPTTADVLPEGITCKETVVLSGTDKWRVARFGSLGGWGGGLIIVCTRGQVFQPRPSRSSCGLSPQNRYQENSKRVTDACDCCRHV